MNLQPATLKNELIKLVPLNESHWEEVYSAASDPLIWAQHPAPDRYKQDVFEKFFQEGIDSKGAFAIVDLKSAEIIGTSRFYDYDEKNRSIAIGYTFLVRKYWGTVYNKALKSLMINYALEYVDEVIFHVGSINIRSQKAVEKLGARKYAEEMRAGKSYVYYRLEKANWIEKEADS
ncbi:MAG: GNAT family N-acetyltransferase [Sphingobacteriaceae bacterium]|nr:GNAT family N-acetyltransferase [Sphingobacteriaceae bacterium]